MGLDNGILIKTRQKLSPESLPLFVNIEMDEYKMADEGGGYWYEVCYWRKCWNIRNIILDIISSKENDDGIYALNKNDIRQLRYALNGYILNPYKWDDDYENGQTIWDSSVMLSHLIRDMANLAWLENYMDNHKVYVEFYDSY